MTRKLVQGSMAAIAAVVAVGLAHSMAAGDPACCEQEAREGGIRELLGKWQRPASGNLEIPLKFNPTIAMDLDCGGGGIRDITGCAMDREQCFAKAVEDWNQALAAGEHRVKFVLATDNNAWTADQNADQCDDDKDNTKDVYDAFYAAAAAGGHHPDMTNAASTGHDHGAVNGQGDG